MNKISTAILIILFVNLIHAQKENNIWYFGNYAGLDFNSGTPIPLENGKMHTLEGCASIANSDGKLLFYTDGVSIWDKNHNIMPDGDSLAGSFSSSQSALIVPMPGNNKKYYIFTTDASFSTKNFSYSIVDMSLNNGNGDIELKNYLLFTPVSERLTAIKHSNNIDYWVLVHHLTNNNFYAFLVSNSGVNINPIVSSIGSIPIGGYVGGCMKFSVNGTKLASVSPSHNAVDLFDFDTSTGTVSNEKHLPIPEFPSGESTYGIEFSYSAKFLYTTRRIPPSIIQWDISSGLASTINNTLYQIDVPTGQEGTLQIACDKKIYVARYYKPGVIEDPESPGILCNYIDTAISVGNGKCYIGLPNIIPSDFQTTSILENSAELKYSVYPNPFVDNITFKVENSNTNEFSYTITNLLGQIVLSIQKDNQGSNISETIDLSFLSSGAYFLKLNMEGNQLVKAIIKE
ncbi:MAG TPA: T9SS type A sorting domain-containing protein [Saprospiraceae bacterium]|nr:T9SS type A sorting domain-containing protein [Saprospiraceae bacterium]